MKTGTVIHKYDYEGDPTGSHIEYQIVKVEYTIKSGATGKTMKKTEPELHHWIDGNNLVVYRHNLKVDKDEAA